MNLRFEKPSIKRGEAFYECLLEGSFSHMALTNKDVISAEEFRRSPEQYIEILNKICSDPIVTKSNHEFIFDEHKIYWVFDDNEEFVGGCSIRYGENDLIESYCGHCGLSVRASKRRQGIGTNIWRFAIQDAKLKNMNYIKGSAHPDNIASWRSLEKAGGRYIADTKDIYGWRPAKLYQIDIKEE